METTRNPDLSAIKQTPQPAWTLGRCGGIPEVSDGSFGGVEAMAVGEMVCEICVGRIKNIDGFVVVVDVSGCEASVENRFCALERAGIEFEDVSFAGEGHVHDADVPVGQAICVEELGEYGFPAVEKAVGVIFPLGDQKPDWVSCVQQIRDGERKTGVGVCWCLEVRERESHVCRVCEHSHEFVHGQNTIAEDKSVLVNGISNGLVEMFTDFIECTDFNVVAGYISHLMTPHDPFDSCGHGSIESFCSESKQEIVGGDLQRLSDTSDVICGRGALSAQQSRQACLVDFRASGQFRLCNALTCQFHIQAPRPDYFYFVHAPAILCLLTIPHFFLAKIAIMCDCASDN